MARTASNMLPLNTKAFDFSLLNTVNNKLEKLNSLKGEKGTIIMFICNHCPFVIHVNPELVNIANDYQQKGIGFIAISSNDVVKYPQDGPELMKQHAKNNEYPFPYLYDATQEVAKAYDAACTPDFFLFNENLELVYRGQLDDSRPGNEIKLTGKDLRSALDCLLNNTAINELQKPSIGCNIKWK
jgi:thiol-disulfide isomerase/thioredoxin